MPGTILDLVETLGGALAFKLLELYGGSIIFVPTRAAADHPMRLTLTDEGFELLVRKYANERLELPKYDAIARQHRYRLVQELRERGHSLTNIALRSNYTRRQVINIMNISTPPKLQMDLFAEADPDRDLDYDVPTAHDPFGLGRR